MEVDFIGELRIRQGGGGGATSQRRASLQNDGQEERASGRSANTHVYKVATVDEREIGRQIRVLETDFSSLLTEYNRKCFDKALEILANDDEGKSCIYGQLIITCQSASFEFQSNSNVKSYHRSKTLHIWLDSDDQVQYKIKEGKDADMVQLKRARRVSMPCVY